MIEIKDDKIYDNGRNIGNISKNFFGDYDVDIFKDSQNLEFCESYQTLELARKSAQDWINTQYDFAEIIYA